MMGKLADQADRIGQQNALACRQFELARGGVQRGKQLVLGKDARIGQPIEQSRLARVGIADDGDLGKSALITGGTHGATSAIERFQLLLQRTDAALNVAAVAFQLRFAGAARTDAAAQARHLRALTDQTGRGIAQLCQLDL